MVAEPAALEAAVDGPRICQPGGQGLFLPFGGESEQGWDTRLKVLLYVVGLIYCFLGVSIVADMFMNAIERITSQKKKVKLAGTDRQITVQVWNETVANLTLMALGSSAPEILLALNDVLKNRFFEGKLGPSTIVGSAAFNLFCIIAVCINSVPNGETRRIKEMNVFVVTAAWSIFAYLWLLFIVTFNSSDVIEVWEGVATFLFFPCLVGHSWATDSGLLKWEKIQGYCRALVTRRARDEDEDEEPASCCWSICGPPARTICWIIQKIFGLVLACFFCVFACCRRKSMSEQHEEAERAVVHERVEDDVGDLEDVILDDDGHPLEAESGIMSFKNDVQHVMGSTEERTFSVTVYRRNGDRGRVTVKYTMEALTAIPGYDYQEDEGELIFRDGVLEQEFEVTILAKSVGERPDSFQVIIEDDTDTVVFNPWHDGGEARNILTVLIGNENPKAHTIRQKVWSCLDGILNIDEWCLGFHNWKDQVLEALLCGGSREEQESAGITAWILHVIWVPWKVPFAFFVAPPTFMGGWVCFIDSLLGIGLLTMLIGDLAELFGCALGIDDSITAITIVAMGTSVPDLFASRNAAKTDEYADASIVNVTGSNSVNVFLGIGLPWMWAAIYWSVNGADQDWTNKYGAEFGDTWGKNGGAAFIVRSGQLFFSVCVFTVAACVCLTVIVGRRILYGGELGGPADPKAYSSCLLILLWLFYIGLSTWKLMTKTEDATTQILAVAISIPVIMVLMLLFAALMKTLKLSKKNIGEEGVWGLFIATFVIIARILVYFAFQWQW